MSNSWNDIKTRAAGFAHEFKDASDEKSDAQAFWFRFFEVFGISAERVGVFEKRVKKINKRIGFADYFWPGLLLIEHKSRGLDLQIAQEQAENYCVNLSADEHPRYLLVCDFEHFWLQDLLEGTEKRFTLSQLPQNVSLFAFLLGQQSAPVQASDPINDRAVQKLAKLHTALRRDGYKRHPLQLLLVRLLFCMFADKTGLFEPAGRFTDLLERGTAEDGSNVGQVLTQLFDELDTEINDRQSKAPTWFKDFPYVNGHLFQEKIRTASFDAHMRQLLLDCCTLDWGRISPAVFGSMFQHIMDEAGLDSAHDLRRELGAHYTSEDNILKLIGPLFLDALKAELDTARGSVKALFEFQKKLRRLQFLDPACGCGNFLVITYRELRLLEIEVFDAVKRIAARGAKGLSGLQAIETGGFKHEMVNVDQFSGIEFEEFPARVAQVAMWLVDHQMNIRMGQTLEAWIPRLPLKHSAHIRIGDALEVDWAELCPPSRLHFILGNPPFVGKQMQTPAQKESMERLLASAHIQGGGVLDLVAGWYIKATQYLTNAAAAQANERKKQYKDAKFATARQASILDDAPTGADASLDDLFALAEAQDLAEREKIKVAFVSTNSICQGEQVGLLWGWMLAQGMGIEFAHRTFKWANDAAGQAAVHCVIVGFGLQSRVGQVTPKRLFDYQNAQGQSDANGQEVEQAAHQINPYLVDAPMVALPSRRQTLCDAPEITYGSFALDDGNYTLSIDDRQLVLSDGKQAEKYMRRFVGGLEILNGIDRWCLWLEDAKPNDLQNCPEILRRISEVKVWRSRSSRATTVKLAASPMLFAEIRQPSTQYVAIPTVSSERRNYIPIAFLKPNVIASNQLYIVPDATLYHFAILTSAMHMAWVRYTCGRMKSDYRYSANIVYNNFPWPNLDDAQPTGAAQKVRLEAAAQAVLDARAAHQKGTSAATLATLYDPDLMPSDLRQAHAALDALVDLAYAHSAAPAAKGGKPPSQKTTPKPPRQMNDSSRVALLFERYQSLVQLANAQAQASSPPETTEGTAKSTPAKSTPAKGAQP